MKKDEDIMYFHVRVIDILSKQSLVNSSPAYREYAYTQGATFAFEKRKDGWWVGYSQTTYEDNFCRRIGRLIAKGRLKCKRKPCAYFFGKEEPTFDDVVTLYELLRYEMIYHEIGC